MKLTYLTNRIFVLLLIGNIFAQVCLASSSRIPLGNSTIQLSVQKYAEVKMNTCDLLDLELQLFKINLFYQLNTIQYSRKRYLTGLITRGLNVNLSLGGMIQSVIYNTRDASYMHVPLIDPLSAVIPRMSGKILLIIGTLIDYGIEKHRNSIQTINGVSLKQLDARIYELIDKIDLKLKERELITQNIKSILPEAGIIVEDETSILQDLRNLGLIYWRNYHVRELKAFYTDRIYKGMLILKKGGGVAGAIVRIVGDATGNPYFTMPANVITTATGVMSMRLPVFVLPTSKYLANNNKIKTDKALDINENDYNLNTLIVKLNKDRNTLETNLKILKPSINESSFPKRVCQRILIYNNFHFNTSEYEPAEVIDRHLFDPYTKRTEIVKTLNGFGRMQRGIFGVVAGTVFLHNHYKRSHMIGYSNIGYLATSSIRSVVWAQGAYKYFKNRKIIETRISDFKDTLNNKLDNLDTSDILVKRMKKSRIFITNLQNHNG